SLGLVGARRDLADQRELLVVEEPVVAPARGALLAREVLLAVIVVEREAALVPRRHVETKLHAGRARVTARQHFGLAGGPRRAPVDAGLFAAELETHVAGPRVVGQERFVAREVGEAAP